MGKVNSAVVATVLIGHLGCAALVLSGVAGGLDPTMAIGDVIVADRVIQHDAGLIENGRFQTYQPGHLPFINPTDQLGFEVNAELMARVRECLSQVALPTLSSTTAAAGRSSRVAYGTILSGDQFLHCGDTRDRWRREFGALAVEMEGGSVAQVAEAFAVPWLVIRALSDLAGQDSGLDFVTFVSEKAASSAAVLRRVIPLL
jgi:adenosylhomocysteine nucleosidase